MNNNELILSLKKKRDEYTKIVESMNETIRALELTPSDNISQDKIHDDGYEPSWGISEKIAFFFNKEHRFLHNREMAEIANEREPDVTVDEFVLKFASTLSRLKRQGKITSIKIGNSLRDTFWGAKEWLESENNPLKEYSINEKYLSGAKEKKFEIV